MALLRKKVKKKSEPNGSDSTHIAQELYRKNVELANTNHTLSLLRAIDNLVLEPNNTLVDLAQGVASALVENSDYLFSLIFIRHSRDDDTPMGVGGYGAPQSEGAKTIGPDAVKKLILQTDHPWFDAAKYSQIIDVNSSKSEFLKKAFDDQAVTVIEFAKQYNCPTICLIKLMARRKLVGAMMVGLGTPVASLDPSEVEYLGRIGEAAGLATDNKLLFEENQQVLKKLKLSNEKLKALDEAKDEFISMASHQLRTPLTSVKGYVSMVMEGDAGKITPQQRQLLNQAFTSSQRMVYLIADLLNVSRLKTGKFLIEAAPTQLADVVETELQQVLETAKVHNLELTYDKPANFPVLNLDETKTRQVIMNFVDNAIYYTPSGGHIKVELTADDKTASYKVIDDGLGVPKAEQPHLFTKFYRAENAKKARPDGTGLGLFMAQKVIIAQGGAIIFQSEEGKGSTFGFSFPLDKLHTSTQAPAKS